MDDLKAWLCNRVQLTTDGHKAYSEAVEGASGGDVVMPSWSKYMALQSRERVATALLNALALRK